MVPVQNVISPELGPPYQELTYLCDIETDKPVQIASLRCVDDDRVLTTWNRLWLILQHRNRSYRKRKERGGKIKEKDTTLIAVAMATTAKYANKQAGSVLG